jgi:hemerythrin superfamily protein
MSEKELQRLYDLLEKVTDEDEKAALRHAIYIIENYNHIY